MQRDCDWPKKLAGGGPWDMARIIGGAKNYGKTTDTDTILEVICDAPMPKIQPLGLAAVCLAGILFNTSVLAQVPSKTSLNPYPDELLQGLLDSCRYGKQRFYLPIPLTQTNTTTIRAITDEQLAPIDKLVKEAEDKVKKEADEATKEVEAKVEQRKVELAALIRDRQRFEAQLKLLKETIASKQVPPDQLIQLQTLLKDLLEIQRAPAALDRKAADSRRSLLEQIRVQAENARNQVRKQASEARSSLTSCTCKIETLQRQYSTQAFYKRALAEFAEPSASTRSTLAKEWADIDNTCKQ
jgi:hypothetical protein